MGQPHSIIRHPDMPRAVFKLLWDTLFEGREVFAYVKNMAKSGDYYWVFAHVTPSFDQDKKNHRVSSKPSRSRSQDRRDRDHPGLFRRAAGRATASTMDRPRWRPASSWSSIS